MRNPRAAILKEAPIRCLNACAAYQQDQESLSTEELVEGIEDPWWRETLLHNAPDLAERIEGKLAKTTQGKTGCLELGTSDQPDRLQWRGKRLKTYQLVAWGCAGEVPTYRSVVRHLCNNRACINPEHLKVGTQAENLFDQRSTRRKGRMAQ